MGLELIGTFGVPGVPDGCPFDQVHECRHRDGHAMIHFGGDPDWDIDLDADDE